MEIPADLIEPLKMPVYLMPGNHDDRVEMEAEAVVDDGIAAEPGGTAAASSGS